MCFISWYRSQTLSIIIGGFTALQTSELFKNQQNQICPYNYNNIKKDLFTKCWASRSGLGGLRASSLEAPGLHDTNLNTLRTQPPGGSELLEHIKIVSSSLMKWVLNFIRNPKLAHILVNHKVLSFCLTNLIEPFVTLIIILVRFISTFLMASWFIESN